MKFPNKASCTFPFIKLEANFNPKDVANAFKQKLITEVTLFDINGNSVFFKNLIKFFSLDFKNFTATLNTDFIATILAAEPAIIAVSIAPAKREVLTYK